MIGPTEPIQQGSAFSLPIQCGMRPAGAAPAYGATDILTASIVQEARPTPIAVFTPTATWFTAQSTQTGYDQGEVEIEGTSAQAAMLWPGNRYFAEVKRALVGTPANTETIAIVPLAIIP